MTAALGFLLGAFGLWLFLSAVTSPPSDAQSLAKGCSLLFILIGFALFGGLA